MRTRVALNLPSTRPGQPQPPSEVLSKMRLTLETSLDDVLRHLRNSQGNRLIASLYRSLYRPMTVSWHWSTTRTVAARVKQI